MSGTSDTSRYEVKSEKKPRKGKRRTQVKERPWFRKVRIDGRRRAYIYKRCQTNDIHLSNFSLFYLSG